MDNADRSQWTVLVVDDDDKHRYATRRMLEAHGYKTLDAQDGAQAIQQAGGADAVVLDVAMPEMTGFEVCAALRSLDQSLELVIIQYSAVFTTAADRVAGLRGGADAYLTKSGDGDVLVANLDAQLKKRERLRRLERQQRAAAEQEAKARDLFLAVLGHDLRGPMQAVTTGAKTILLAKDASPVVSKTATRILSSADRITTMLDDLRDYALVKIGSGLGVHRERVDLTQLLRHCIEEVQVSHSSTRFVVSGVKVEGSWDQAKIFRVAMNLLRNAVQHGQPGEPISVDVTELEGNAVLRVRNTGAPSAHADVDNLQEPHVRGAQTGTAGADNLGLGLFICKQIVQAHGGDIDMQSDGATTLVTVRLPILS